jgi:hypothetical protein
MTSVVNRAMAWSGLAVLLLTFGGFLLARLLPVPPGADLSAEQIADFYSTQPTMTRVGLLVASLGLSLLAPMVALITSLMLRIKAAPPGLAYLQQVGGIGVVVVTVLPMIVMNVAAFRVDRNPVVIQAINDLAWLVLITPIGLFVMQEVPIAIAILMDRATHPLFPRWVGYANIWIPLTFLPALCAYFVTTGPVAWQGVLVFYLGLATFGAWVVIMTWALVRAIRRTADEDSVE